MNFDFITALLALILVWAGACKLQQHLKKQRDIKNWKTKHRIRHD